MTELKPCPFLACQDASARAVGVGTSDDGDYLIYTVVCDSCGASGPSAYSREDAVDEWNTRRQYHD